MFFAAALVTSPTEAHHNDKAVEPHLIAIITSFFSFAILVITN
jgi:hypothetical protein